MAAHFLPQRQSNWAPSAARPHHGLFAAISDFTGNIIGATWQISAGYGLEASYYDQHRVGDGLERAWRTSLMDTEAWLLASGITMSVKRLAGRCRPRAWHPKPGGGGVCGPEDAEYDAFPSGHTTSVGAVAGSHLVLALRSSGQSAPRWVGFGLAEGFTVATAVLRVLAGAHSWEDTVGGWAVGHLSGALVALAHPMISATDSSSSVEPGPPAGATAPATIMFSWSGRL